MPPQVDAAKATNTAASATAATTNAGDPSNLNGPSATVDFTTLPASAIVAYIDFHNLATAYPPAAPPGPASHYASPTPSEADEDEYAEGDEGAEETNNAAAGGDEAPVEDSRTEEEMLAEASGKRRAALASAAATSTSYSNSREAKFRQRSPPATTVSGGGGGVFNTPSSSRKRNAAAAALNSKPHLNSDGTECPQDFYDDEDAQSYLAGVAQKHFAAQPPPKEGEVVVGFLWRAKNQGGLPLMKLSRMHGRSERKPW